MILLLLQGYILQCLYLLTDLVQCAYIFTLVVTDESTVRVAIKADMAVGIAGFFVFLCFC